ncbi:hypothetical protein Tdes44962_MAKER04631 [Teratosphaeria destructans]|uniref:Uncharacterized protein n=1 Tax=Teratosphaeria destructans TaxID=418781 RepID=A0A9W7SLR1_9PEZI|nr:hypothetical protein Tdes44962_MAKER04631 [Teratosphaeria destructans]
MPSSPPHQTGQELSTISNRPFGHQDLDTKQKYRYRVFQYCYRPEEMIPLNKSCLGDHGQDKRSLHFTEDCSVHADHAGATRQA